MVMDLVIWPATLVLVVVPTRLFRRELFPLGIFQSGTTLGFKRVPRAAAMFQSLKQGLEECIQMVTISIANEIVQQKVELWAAAVMKHAKMNYELKGDK